MLYDTYCNVGHLNITSVICMTTKNHIFYFLILKLAKRDKKKKWKLKFSDFITIIYKIKLAIFVSSKYKNNKSHLDFTLPDNINLVKWMLKLSYKQFSIQGSFFFFFFLDNFLNSNYKHTVCIQILSEHNSDMAVTIEKYMYDIHK